MCGIAAIIGSLPAQRADSSIRAMLDAQLHRGPDDGGSTVLSLANSVVALGNRRLAIQDLSPLGHQPMVNDATGDVLVYNGEIYNAPDLRSTLQSEGFHFRGHSDTEVLLRAYESWGIDCVDRLRGMFAFALWDARRARLVIARDHLGIKPLYYSQKAGHWFLCASEVRALLQSGLVPPTIDRRGLAGYLAYGGAQEPLTIYENVLCLPRGSWLEFDTTGKQVAEGRYWDFPATDPAMRQRSTSDLVEEGRELLQRAVRRHLLSDVRLGVFLSSGLDSTAVLALSRGENGSGEVDAFTVSFPDQPSYDELALARTAAARLNTRHHNCPVGDSTAIAWISDALQHMDQPSMDGFNTFIVARAVREQGIVVALSGLGGDEVFGGYDLVRRVPDAYRLASMLRPIPPGLRATGAWAATLFRDGVTRKKAVELARTNPELAAIYFRFRRLLSDSELRSLGLDAATLALSEDFQVRDLDKNNETLPCNGCYVPGDEVISTARLDAAFYMQNILLRDSDVFGMASSLELRVPFLDRDLVDWAWSLPGDVLLPEKQQKYLLRKICAAFYSEPQLSQRKRGFVLPFAAWLQGPLRDVREESLASLQASGVLDPAGIRRVSASFRREPYSPAWSRVWALVTLTQWLNAQSRTHVPTVAAQPA